MSIGLWYNGYQKVVEWPENLLGHPSLVFAPSLLWYFDDRHTILLPGKELPAVVCTISALLNQNFLRANNNSILTKLQEVHAGLVEIQRKG
jgi:hypothetical protein